MFSRDVTAAMLVYLNNRTAAMLVYPTNPSGIELCYHANVFLCIGGLGLGWKNKVTDHMSESTLLTIRPAALEGERSNCFSITQLVG